MSHCVVWRGFEARGKICTEQVKKGWEMFPFFLLGISNTCVQQVGIVSENLVGEPKCPLDSQ